MRTQLYNHNKTAYQKVMRAFETADRTCVVHPTGTGKSYLIAAVSESFKRVLILGPNTFVLDQVHSVLKWRKRGVEYMTYQTLNLTENPHTDYDLICLDEFHRTGAPEWGAAVDRLLELNTEANVFGTTATHIRYLDNERNMADELFHGNIASYITIAEAWNQNILPIPRYVSGLFRWDNTVSEAQERIERSRSLSDKEKRERIFRLTNAHLHWELSYGMPAILKKHLDRDARRVIVFCGNIESLGQMRDEVVGWFREADFTVAGTCIMHSDLADREQREQMDRFEDDGDGKGVKLMFSVNMLNEGVHVPNVNAVLMLRTTSSRIIYMQQMGRCLTTANTEKPLVLDMVDNITTTTAIKGLLDEFDAIEIQQAEREGREPRKFEVKDYTLGVRDLISKLVQDTYTLEERLQIINSFVDQHDRLPKVSEPEYKHWTHMSKYARNHPQVQALMKRFLKGLTLDELKQRIRTFAEENDRWPKRYIRSYSPSKEERSLSRNFGKYCDEILKDDDFRSLYEYYRDKDKLTFDGQYAIFIGFCQRYDRLPTLPLKKEHRESVTDEERQAANSWAWLRKNFPGDERVKVISQEYGRKNLREKEIKRRVKLLTAFITEKQRQPNNYYPEEVQLQGYMNILRVSPYNEREDVKELIRLADSVKHEVQDVDELLEEYIRFCETNKKVPSSHSKDACEAGLYKRAERRKALWDNQRFLAVRDKYKKVPMSREEKIRIVLEHCEKTGHRPSKETSSPEVYRAWGNIFRTDKALADEIRAKYPAVRVWSDEDTERYAEQIMAFVREHNRRPNVRLDDLRLYNIFRTLQKAKADHPAVIRLKEVLDQLPSYQVPKYYDRKQLDQRRRADSLGYKIIKDRGENPVTRYIIFYTADTKRNERYEQKCHEAGLEIKEYKQ